MPAPLVSLIVPARDEADNLPSLLDEIEQALGTLDHEVLVVDDGSRDRSWELLCERAADDPQLMILRHAVSAGQSTSIWHAARLARGTWLATLDADGQNDPTDIPRLLEQAQRNGVAMIIGHRTLRRDSWLKRVSSRIANRVRATLLGDATPDTGCGLKIVRRDIFLALPYFDHMHRFLPALIQSQGGRCLSLPVKHRPRRAGCSHYGLHDRLWAGLVDLLGVIWLCRRSRLPIMTAPLQTTDDVARHSKEDA